MNNYENMTAIDYSANEEEPVILPIPYEDEAAEEERAAKARLESLRSNAPAIVPLPDETVGEEVNRKAAEAENARIAAESALAAAQAARRNAEAAVAEAQIALDKQRGLEAAAEAVKTAEITFDADGNSIIKIKVPKNYDLQFSFTPKIKK